MRYQTHSEVRLGDNLAALHWLRAVAKAHPDDSFVHYCWNAHLPQLIDVVCDLPNIALNDIRYKTGASVDTWKGKNGIWYNHPNKNKYAEFFLWFFGELAFEMGVRNPFAKPDDLLFDYPNLKHNGDAGRFDFLIVNSHPLSGQWKGYNQEEFDALVIDLSKRHQVITTHPVPGVPCTQSKGHSITGIGKLSQACDHILMVSTGCSWTTLNAWNKDTVKSRIILIDSEEIGLSKNTTQCREIREARAVLSEDGLI